MHGGSSFHYVTARSRGPVAIHLACHCNAVVLTVARQFWPTLFLDVVTIFLDMAYGILWVVHMFGTVINYDNLGIFRCSYWHTHDSNDTVVLHCGHIITHKSRHYPNCFPNQKVSLQQRSSARAPNFWSINQEAFLEKEANVLFWGCVHHSCTLENVWVV